MDVPRRLSFLSYAVNGSGVGHVVRQIAIQKWLRRLCAFAGTKSEHWFLTTSEADAMVFREGFAAFKLPSKTILEDAGVDKLAYVAMAKQWVWNSLTLLRPDTLVVDTFPNGSFFELGNALDVVHKKVLVLRPLKETFARGHGGEGTFRALAMAYDRILVPEHEDDCAGLLDALGLPAGRIVFSGPVLRGDRCDLHSRAEARARLGVAGEDKVLLVTAGGGGDASVDAFFDDVDRALVAAGADDVHVVWGAGPLFRGRPRHGPRRTFFVGHDLFEHGAAFDVAVAAGGFNTVHELLWVGVPALVVPQDKIADDQAARAARYVARGALRTSTRATVVREALALLRDDESRAALARAARAAVPENHAKDAAAAVLALHLPPSLVTAAVAAVDDALLAGARALRGSVADVVDLALALQGRGDRVAIDVRAALSLATDVQAPPAALARVVEQLRKKARVDDAAPLVRALLSHDAIHGQLGALQAVLAALVPERGLDGRVLVDALRDAAARVADAGCDLAALARTLPSVMVDATTSTGAVGRLRAAALVVSSSSSPTTMMSASTGRAR